MKIFKKPLFWIVLVLIIVAIYGYNQGWFTKLTQSVAQRQSQGACLNQCLNTGALSSVCRAQCGLSPL